MQQSDEMDRDGQSESRQGSDLPAFIAVEHPGQVRSLDRALETLGGPAALKGLADDPVGAPLELRFRPKNRFEHPIQSHHVKSSNLVIKVRKSSDAQGLVKMEHEAVGVIKNTRRFRDICDFQWITKDSPFVQRLEKAAAANDASEMGLFSLGPEEDPTRDDLDIIPPPVFSTTVVQHAYNYKQNPAAKKVQTDSGLKFVNRSRGVRQFLLTTAFEDKTIPTEPSPRLSKAPTEEIKTIIEKLEELFAQRPMWTRRGLSNSLRGSINLHILKFAIPYVAYMWKSGPWRDCYVKFGLDPRTDSAYAVYQAIYCINRAPEKSENGLDITPSESHIFDGRTLYPAGRTFMLIDMTDPLLSQMRERAPKRSRPHARDGWWYSSMITATRATLKGKITALCNGKIPSDLEFADMLRTATEPDAMKEDSLPDASEEEAVRNEDEDDSGRSADDDDDGENRDQDDPEEEALDERIESLVSGIIRANDDFGTTTNGKQADAFAGIDEGIFGSDSE